MRAHAEIAMIALHQKKTVMTSSVVVSTGFNLNRLQVDVPSHVGVQALVSVRRHPPPQINGDVGSSPGSGFDRLNYVQCPVEHSFLFESQS